MPVAGSGSPPPGQPPERFPERWASHWGEDPFGLWQGLTYKGVRQGFRWIPPTPIPFLMGSPSTEHGRYDEETQHEVLLTRGFWLAETTCSQGLWAAVMGENPSQLKGERRPVETVSWDDAQRFIERLNTEIQTAERVPARFAAAIGAGPPGRHSTSQSEQTPPLRLRLPTEAEWEYACRAGTTGPFSFGDDIDPGQANFDGNYPYRGDRKGLYREETVDVGPLPPNAWGLYEMHGNVWEWCRDGYGDYPSEPISDPTGPESGERRVLRGGSWINVTRSLRSAYRFRSDPGFRNRVTGFRLALGPELGPAGEAGRGRGRTARARSER